MPWTFLYPIWRGNARCRTRSDRRCPWLCGTNFPKMMMWGYHWWWWLTWRIRRFSWRCCCTPSDDGGGADDDETESDDGNSDQVPNNLTGGPHAPRGPRGGHGPKGPIGPMTSVFMNLHVKCPVFSKWWLRSKHHLLCSNNWMNSQGIVRDSKCGRFCLTLGSYAYL